MLEKKSGWNTIDKLENDKIMNFCDSYINFLNIAKTERLAVREINKRLEDNGFVLIDKKDKLVTGDKVYYSNNNKCVYCAVIGEDDISSGLQIIGSHIDSPRLDLKPNPIYEEGNLCLFKTHYYGGIKKYQWTSIPLGIFGVIYTKDNKKLDISIGSGENDPVFTITDLLPHLSSKQNDTKLFDAIKGEELNVLIGSIPSDDDKKSVKENILKLLNTKYNIDEDSFLSAELELVPAFDAKSLGLDKSMIAGYGQDDRVCAYTSLQAIIKTTNPSKTAVAIFADKEEIGSVGNTGMMSNKFDLFVSELLDKTNELTPNSLLKTFSNSNMLSADVGAGVDPNHMNVNDLNNTSFIGYGVEITKYTGSRGKSGASDANAEYINLIKTLFKDNNIPYQFPELGKIDEGGGGTIAFILANKGINVVDCGVPIISMHSPYEVSSKLDVYNAYRAYKTFFGY